MAKKPAKKTQPSLFTPDDLIFDRNSWVEALSTDIELVKKDYPDVPIYEYQLVAVHTPPPTVTEYIRTETQ